MDIIDVTQTAMLRFDLNAGKGDFSIDTGPWGPKITPGLLDQCNRATSSELPRR